MPNSSGAPRSGRSASPVGFNPLAQSSVPEHRLVIKSQCRAGSRSSAGSPGSADKSKRTSIRSKSCDEKSFKTKISLGKNIPLESKSSENVYEDAFSLDQPSTEFVVNDMATEESVDEAKANTFEQQGDALSNQLESLTKLTKNARNVVDVLSPQEKKVAAGAKSNSAPKSPRDLSPAKSVKGSSKLPTLMSKEAPGSSTGSKLSKDELILKPSLESVATKSIDIFTNDRPQPISPRNSTPMKFTMSPVRNTGVRTPRTRLLSKNSPSKIPAPQAPISASASESVCTLASKKKKPPVRVTVIQSTAKRTLEVQFACKKKRLSNLKRDLFERQKPVIDLYQTLLDMRKQITITTGKHPSLEEIRILDNYKTEAQCQELEDNKIYVDAALLNTMTNRLREIPGTCIDMCRDLHRKRAEILDWLIKEPVAKNVMITRQLETYRKETDTLDGFITELAKLQSVKVKDLVDHWRALWERKETFEDTCYEELKREIQSLKERLQSTTVEMEKSKQQKHELEKKYKEAELQIVELHKNLHEKSAELETEKAGKVEKSLIANYDAKLKMAKQRIRDLELKSQKEETKIELLNNTIKQLQDQWKSKESVFENRTRDILKSAKLNDALMTKMEKERNSFELRVKDLEQLLEERETGYNQSIKELVRKLEVTEKELMETHAERVRNEKKYAAVRDRLVKIEIKNQQVADLAKKKKTVSRYGMASNENMNTQAEIEMWTELQATRVALKCAEEKLSKQHEVQARFMQTIDKAVVEKDTLTSEGWTARLIQKDEEIERLQHKVEQLSDTIVYSQDLASKQEKKITELKKTLESLMETDSEGKGDRNDLNNLVQDEKEKLEQSIKRNVELEQKLAAKEHALNIAQSKVNEQENLIKIRDGIIGILKSKKEMTTNEYEKLKENAGDLVHQYNEINSKLALKSEQLDALYTTLECKTIQVERLERTVKSMEKICKDTNIHNTELQEKIKNYQKMAEGRGEKSGGRRFPFF